MSLLVPSARAAAMSARWVRLLDPGTATVASTLDTVLISIIFYHFYGSVFRVQYSSLLFKKQFTLYVFRYVRWGSLCSTQPTVTAIPRPF